MDRKFDFRVLLIQIQNRLSDDDRRRFHFLIGDIIPRHQRDDCTLGGTLTLLESLFDRAMISEDYLGFLIRVFGEIQCFDAVRRLQEYQITRAPLKETLTPFSDVLSDNCEEDKITTQISNEMYSVELNNISSKKPDRQGIPTTEPSQSENTIEHSFAPVPPKERLKNMFTSPVTFCLFIMFIVEILALSIYLLIHFHKDSLISLAEKKFRRDAYIIKYGKSSLQNLSRQSFNHAENLSLTFADRLMSIDVCSFDDELYSLEFIYSRNKSIVHRLRNTTRLHQPLSSRLTFTERNIEEITQCSKDNNQSAQLVGLRFRMQGKSLPLIGSCDGRSQLKDVYANHVFGYARGETDEYLKGFQFVWYNICPLDRAVTSCVNDDSYSLNTKNVYRD